MKAITGRKSSPNAFKDDPHERACIFMAEEHHRDKAAGFRRKWDERRGDLNLGPPPKIRSARELAHFAEEKFFGLSDEGARKAKVDRLREMFSGTYQKKLNANPKVDHKATWLYRAVAHDHVQESLEKQSLEQIAAELERWDVPTKL